MEREPNEAEFAVLDAALDEVLDGKTPPDVWPRLLSAMGRQAEDPAGAAEEGFDARDPSRTHERRRPWLLVGAAIAAAVVVALLLIDSRMHVEDRELSASTLPPLDVDVHGPIDLQQLQQWLREGGLRGAAIEAESVWSASLQRSIPMRAYLNEGVFEGDTIIRLRTEELVVMAKELAAAQPHWSAAADRNWEHSVRLRFGSGGPGVPARNARLLVRSAPDGVLRIALATPSGPSGVRFSAEAVALLLPALHDVTEATIAARGIAIGDDGLRAMPDTVTKLRLHHVSADELSGIRRFRSLEQLDVRDAPAWHTVATVRSLSMLPLQALWIDGARLDRAGVTALGQMRSLRELRVIGPGSLILAAARGPTAAVDGDVVGAALMLPNLQSLLLADAGLQDRDLARLMQAPKLKNLGLVGCTSLGEVGYRALAGCQVDSLSLLGNTQVDMAALAGWPELRTLFVHSNVAVEQLAAVHLLSRLEELAIFAPAQLSEEQLVALHGAQQLQMLELSSEPMPEEAAVEALRRALPRSRISVVKIGDFFR